MKARPLVILTTVEMFLACLAGIVGLFFFWAGFIALDYNIIPHTEFQYEAAGKSVVVFWTSTPTALALWIAARAIKKNIPGKWFYQLIPPVTVSLTVFLGNLWL